MDNHLIEELIIWGRNDEPTLEGIQECGRLTLNHQRFDKELALKMWYSTAYFVITSYNRAFGCNLKFGRGERKLMAEALYEEYMN